MSEGVRFATRGGWMLAGIYTPAPAGAPAAALCHGMLSSKESEKIADLAAALAERGVASLRFDFSGRGESGGDPRRILYSQEVEDLGAALDLLRSRGHRRLGIFGSSMGGAVAVIGAGRHPDVAAVTTLAAVARPALFLERAGAREVARWRAQGFFVYDGVEVSAEHLDDAAATDVLGAARRLTVPLLVQHGTGDEVVPVEDGHLLAAAGRGEIVLYAGADHRFSRDEDRRAAVARAAEFLARHLV